MKRVIVIGAGIVGASIAYHLATAGASVRVLETESMSGGKATANSWAWINASWGNDREYVALRMNSMNSWRKIDKKVPGLRVNWCGSVLWHLAEEKLMEFAVEHKSWGYPAEVIEQNKISDLEPALRNPPAQAVRVAIEGAVEPVHAVEKLLVAAQEAGAVVTRKVHAKYLNETNGQVVGIATSEESLEADEVVVAAGTGSAILLESLSLRLNLEQRAGLLVHSSPMREILNGIVLSPKIHVLQTAEGRLVAGSDFTGADPTDDPTAAATALFQNLRELLKAEVNLEMEKYTVGIRPALPDGLPAIGRPNGKPGLYLAVTHSGITLAPIIGEIVASELLDQRRDQSLARYLPDRVMS